MAEGDRIDGYIRRAQAFITSGKLDSDEMEYKLKIVHNLEKARHAVLTEDGEWASLVERGLTKDNNNLDDWHPRSVLLRWIGQEPAQSLHALQGLWSRDDIPLQDRISGFVAAVPEDGQFKGTGTRMRSVSVLLMALGPDHPPFKVTEFDKAYERTGYGQLQSRADEGAQYEHALAFLDQLVERTSALGFDRPSNRLEAHSVVWMNETVGTPADRDMTALIDAHETSAVEQGAFAPTDLPDARERVASFIVRRRGQPQFRQQLLEAYDGRCALTGCDVEEVLEACHIVPYRGPSTDHPENGLLLRADLHTLFDRGLIALDSATTTVVVAEKLQGSLYESLAGASLREPSNGLRPSPDALDEHRKWAGL